MDNIYCIKTVFNKLQTLNNVQFIKAYDFNGLFNNIHFTDHHKITNPLYTEYCSTLMLTNKSNTHYLPKLNNFLIYSNFIMKIILYFNKFRVFHKEQELPGPNFIQILKNQQVRRMGFKGG